MYLGLWCFWEMQPWLGQYCSKQTNKPLPLSFYWCPTQRLDNTNRSSLSLWEPILLMQSERERKWLMRERAWGRDGAGNRDVEKREQLVLRADTGHIAKDSAAAYAAVKQPLCLFTSLHQLSLAGFSSLCRYRDRLLPSHGKPAGLRFFWDQHQVSAEILGQQWVQTLHTHTCTQY